MKEFYCDRMRSIMIDDNVAHKCDFFRPDTGTGLAYCFNCVYHEPHFPFRVVKRLSKDEPPKTYFKVLLYVGSRDEIHPIAANEDYWIDDPYGVIFERVESALNYINQEKEKIYARAKKMRSA